MSSYNETTLNGLYDMMEKINKFEKDLLDNVVAFAMNWDKIPEKVEKVNKKVEKTVKKFEKDLLNNVVAFVMNWDKIPEKVEKVNKKVEKTIKLSASLTTNLKTFKKGLTIESGNNTLEKMNALTEAWKKQNKNIKIKEKLIKKLYPKVKDLEAAYSKLGKTAPKSFQYTAKEIKKSTPFIQKALYSVKKISAAYSGFEKTVTSGIDAIQKLGIISAGTAKKIKDVVSGVGNMIKGGTNFVEGLASKDPVQMLKGVHTVIKGINSVFDSLFTKTPNWKALYKDVDRSKIALKGFKKEVIETAKKLRKENPVMTGMDAMKKAYEQVWDKTIKEADSLHKVLVLSVKLDVDFAGFQNKFNRYMKKWGDHAFSNPSGLEHGLERGDDGYDKAPPGIKDNQDWKKDRAGERSGLAYALSELMSNFDAVAKKQKEFDNYYIKSVTEIVKWNKTHNNSIKSINDYVKAQIQDTLKYYNVLKASKEPLATELLGESGIAIYEELIKKNDRFKKAKETLDQVKALDKVFGALHNTANVSKERFDDFQKAAQNSYQALMDSGLDKKEALEQIAPILKRINALHKDEGYEINSNTQDLVDQASKYTDAMLPVRSAMDNLLTAVLYLIKLNSDEGEFPSVFRNMLDSGIEDLEAIEEHNKNAMNNIGNAIGDTADKAKDDLSGVYSGPEPGDEEGVNGWDNLTQGVTDYGNAALNTKTQIDDAFMAGDKAVDKVNEDTKVKTGEIKGSGEKAEEKVTKAAEDVKNNILPLFGEVDGGLIKMAETSETTFGQMKNSTFAAGTSIEEDILAKLKEAGHDVNNMDDETRKAFEAMVERAVEVEAGMSQSLLSEDKGFKKMTTVATAEMDIIKTKVGTLDGELDKMVTKSRPIKIGWNVDRVDLNDYLTMPKGKRGHQAPQENYANGTFGWINTPSRFIVGEGGEPELLESVGGKTRITPLSRIPKIKADGTPYRRGSSDNSQSNTYNISVNGTASRQDKTEFAEIMKSIIRDNFRGTATEIRTKVG